MTGKEMIERYRGRTRTLPEVLEMISDEETQE